MISKEGLLDLPPAVLSGHRERLHFLEGEVHVGRDPGAAPDELLLDSLTCIMGKMPTFS